MSRNRLYFLIPMLLLALLIAGCGSTPTEVAEDDSGFMLALPRVAIEVDEEGSPSIAGIDAETLKTLTFGQADLSGFSVPGEYVEWFDTADLQHIELVHTFDGLYVFVNGKPMPHIGWSGDSLGAASDVAEAFNVLDPRTARIVKLLIPFVQRTGVDVAVKFPTGGSPVIEMRDPSLGIPDASLDPNPEIVQARVHVRYDENGVPSVLAVSSKDVGDALGADLRSVEFGPAMIDQMQNADIQHITARTTPEGILLYVNDKAMPNLAWGEDLLQNGADLYGQLYFTDQYQTARTAVNMILPVLDNIKGEVVLLFPAAAGAEAIPIPSQ